jgi:hypothetical protein
MHHAGEQFLTLVRFVKSRCAARERRGITTSTILPALATEFAEFDNEICALMLAGAAAPSRRRFRDVTTTEDHKA